VELAAGAVDGCTLIMSLYPYCLHAYGNDGLNDIVELVRHSETQICTAARCGSERRG